VIGPPDFAAELLLVLDDDDDDDELDELPHALNTITDTSARKTAENGLL
jgi:hypothetical protein